MKLTQKQIAFNILLKNKDTFTPTYAFTGEHFFEQHKTDTSNGWYLASYKCPARLSDIYNENPDMLERQWVKGKSGSEYYAYKLADNYYTKIKDKKLIEL